MILGYLDAGTGTMLVQLLVGGAAGVAAFVKFRWGSLKNLFRRGDSSD